MNGNNGSNWALVELIELAGYFVLGGIVIGSFGGSVLLGGLIGVTARIIF
jgi:hypothetical protein